MGHPAIPSSRELPSFRDQEKAYALLHHFAKRHMGEHFGEHFGEDGLFALALHEVKNRYVGPRLAELSSRIFFEEDEYFPFPVREERTMQVFSDIAFALEEQPMRRIESIDEITCVIFANCSYLVAVTGLEEKHNIATALRLLNFVRANL